MKTSATLATALLFALLCLPATTAFAADTPALVVQQTEDGATTPVPSGDSTAIMVLVSLGVFLGVAMALWAIRIGKKGYHRTTTNYPTPGEEVEDAINTTNITSPVP